MCMHILYMYILYSLEMAAGCEQHVLIVTDCVEIQPKFHAEAQHLQQQLFYRNS